VINSKMKLSIFVLAHNVNKLRLISEKNRNPLSTK